MYFGDIIGLEETKSALIAGAREHRIPHARLFVGEEGGGALPLAIAFARYVNCEHPSETDACGACASCKMYDRLAHPDLHFLFPTMGGEKAESCDDLLEEWRELCLHQFYPTEADWRDKLMSVGKRAGGQTMIYTREGAILEEKLSLQISQGNYRVVIVFQPEKMNLQLANKLLKVVEEPPERTLFMFVAMKAEKILGTIRSRTQNFSVRALRADEQPLLAAKLGVAAEDQSLSAAFHLAKGNCRQVYDLVTGQSRREKYFSLFERFFYAARKPSPREMKALAEELAAKEGREEQLAFIAYIETYVREMLVFGFHDSDLSYLMPFEHEPSSLLDGSVTNTVAGKAFWELELARKHIAQNVSSKMVFFDLFLRITALLKPCFEVKSLR